MLFNSLEFALFFPLVAILYFVLPLAWKTPLLLVASCAFYMAFIPAYILILLVTILIDYVAGIYLERVTGRARQGLLILSIVATCAVLFVFKYFAFITGNTATVAGWLGWHVSAPIWHIVLPIGLSFHTFQSLSYVVEVYHGRQKAEHNFLTYATYVMFFPQLVAGPIERPQNLLHQFYENHTFDYERVTSGLKRIALGLFKKVVVADRLALYVNDVYAAPREYNGLQLTAATFFFAYQIYCDFSGYSDIAIGSARVLGFRLMENFDRPYAATSTSEFWRRWHISLSTWFRDYVYRPLGGNRKGIPRQYVNLMITFAISGLWHGANWTYVVWGLLNGCYLVAGAATKGVRDRIAAALGLGKGSGIRKCFATATTFLLILAAWVVFRARSLPDAWYVFTHFHQNWDFSNFKTEQFQLTQLPAAVAAIVMLELIQYLEPRWHLDVTIARVPAWFRWPVYAGLVFSVILFGVFRQAQFIYFQF